MFITIVFSPCYFYPIWRYIRVMVCQHLLWLSVHFSVPSIPRENGFVGKDASETPYSVVILAPQVDASEGAPPLFDAWFDLID